MVAQPWLAIPIHSVPNYIYFCQIFQFLSEQLSDIQNTLLVSGLSMPGGEFSNPCLMPAIPTPVPKPRKQRRKTDHQLRDSGQNPWPILHTLTLQPQQLNSLLVELVSNQKSQAVQH